MVIELISVYDVEDHMEILYSILEERTPEQSISHKEMPSFGTHMDFVDSEPYLAWYFIVYDGETAGTIYLTRQREIGISIFNKYQRNRIGERAVKALMAKHPGKFLANINPKNEASIRFFKKFGAKHIQNTYLIEQNDQLPEN